MAKDWRQFTRANQKVMDDIMSVMIKHEMPAKQGTIVLFFLAGMSAGLDDQALVDSEYLEAQAVGWQLGVNRQEFERK